MSNSFPPKVINAYFWEKFGAEYEDAATDYEVVPFFPIFDNTGGGAAWDSKTYVVYDAIAKYRPGPFYVIKSESMLYSIRGKADSILLWREAVINILDNGDDAAKDINEWAGLYLPNNRIFFHELSVYQSDWAKAPTKAAADTHVNFFAESMIINYKYHRV